MLDLTGAASNTDAIADERVGLTRAEAHRIAHLLDFFATAPADREQTPTASMVAEAQAFAVSLRTTAGIPDPGASPSNFEDHVGEEWAQRRRDGAWVCVSRDAGSHPVAQTWDELLDNYGPLRRI